MDLQWMQTMSSRAGVQILPGPSRSALFDRTTSGCIQMDLEKRIRSLLCQNSLKMSPSDCSWPWRRRTPFGLRCARPAAFTPFQYAAPNLRHGCSAAGGFTTRTFAAAGGRAARSVGRGAYSAAAPKGTFLSSYDKSVRFSCHAGGHALSSARFWKGGESLPVQAGGGKSELHRARCRVTGARSSGTRGRRFREGR